jgi:PGF-pre-PGF domain-containing protein
MKTYHRLISITLIISILFSISAMTVCGYGTSNITDTKSKDSNGNIIVYETRHQNLVVNQSARYQFFAPELSIYEILVTGKSNELNTTVRVEDLIGTSRYVNKSSPGIVYRNENVWIGSDRVEYITVRFRVNNSWMNSNKLNDSHYPHLLKWNGETWLVLKTDIVDKDNNNTYFEAPKAGSTSLSIFAISAQGNPLQENTTNMENNSEETLNQTVDKNITETGGTSRKFQIFEAVTLVSIAIVIGYTLKKT